MPISDIKVGRATGRLAIWAIAHPIKPMRISAVKAIGDSAIEVAVWLIAWHRHLPSKFSERITHARSTAKAGGGIDHGIPISNTRQLNTLSLIGREIFSCQADPNLLGIAQQPTRKISPIKCLGSFIGELLQSLRKTFKLNNGRSAGPVAHRHLAIRQVN